MFTKKKKIIGMYLLFLLLTGAIITYHFLSFETPIVENLYSYAAYPVLRLQATLIASINQWTQQIKDTNQLRAQLNHMQQQCDELHATNIRLYSALKYENDTEQLRTFNQSHPDKDGHITQILMRIFSPGEHYFLVDAGLNHNIKKDMVVSYKNCLVGRVEHVYPWYSKVRLITDSSCKVAACCAQSNAIGIHQGDNNLEKTMLNYISHLSEICPHDLVISSGQGLIFPYGLGLGTIESYEKNGLHYTITVKPIINLRQLSYCTILAKGAHARDSDDPSARDADANNADTSNTGTDDSDNNKIAQ